MWTEWKTKPFLTHSPHSSALSILPGCEKFPSALGESPHAARAGAWFRAMRRGMGLALKRRRRVISSRTMLKKFTGVLARLLLAAALVCALAAAGLAAPRGARANSCPLMNRTHACCKKARNRAAEAPRLLPVRPCCVTNSPQPAPAGTGYNARPAPGAATDPRPAVNAVEPAHVTPHTRAYAPVFS